MASGQILEGSVIVDDHFSFFEDIQEQSSLITSTPFKQSNLLKIDEELVWKGPYESLKLFVKSDLGIDGQWKSTGGEVKKFTSKSYTLKWHGKTKQKLVVIQDDENESLQEKLVKSAMLGNFKGHYVGQRSETIGNKNTLEGVQKSTLSSNDDKVKDKNKAENQTVAVNFPTEVPLAENDLKFTNSACCCREVVSQLKRIEGDIQQLKNRTDSYEGKENSRPCKLNTCESEKANLRNNLEEANNIIKDLRAKVEYLEHEKVNLATALALQQKDYQACLNNLNQPNNITAEMSNNFETVQKTKSSDRKQQADIIPSSSHMLNIENRYQTLSDTLDNESQTESTVPHNLSKRYETKPVKSTCEHQNKQQNPKTREIGSDIIVIGDSIIKNIQPRKLSRKKVHKYTFPGKTAEEIEKEINFDSLKAIPSHVIVHAGTNNLPLESASECAQKIEKLAAKVKSQFPYSKIGLSGLTARRDVAMPEKIDEVNKELQHICMQLDVSFIDNTTIDDTCLNGSKLHLNAKGSAILAVHFIKFLKGGSASTSPSKRRQNYEDFQRSAILKLGELLKIIVPPDKGTRTRRRK
jgi:hypothetical protein